MLGLLRSRPGDDAKAQSITSLTPRERIQAVQSASDQALLAKIAVEDKDSNVRKAAVEKLTDQTVLAKIVAENKDCWAVCQAAVGRLTDQALLMKLAVESTQLGVGEAAVCKLSDQDMLVKIAAIGGSDASSIASEIVRLPPFSGGRDCRKTAGNNKTEHRAKRNLAVLHGHRQREYGDEARRSTHVYRKRREPHSRRGGNMDD